MSSKDLKWLKFQITKKVQLFLLSRLADRHGRNVRFVQIGANDGRTEDPLFSFVTANRWSGLVVEPVARFYQKLVSNYAHLEEVTCIQAVCADKECELDFFEIDDPDNSLPQEMRGISSLYHDVVRGHFESDDAFHKYTRMTKIRAIPMNALVLQHDVKQLNLVLVDTEGADLKVIEGFDLDKFRPDLVMMEHYHLSSSDVHKLYNTMQTKGYNRFIGAMDTFFFYADFIGTEEMDCLSSFRLPVLSWTWEDNHLTPSTSPARSAGFTVQPFSYTLDTDYSTEAAACRAEAGLRSFGERAIRGIVGVCLATEIRGWAFDPMHPDKHLTVEVWAEGRPIGTTEAGLFRPNLAQAGIGKGDHGFIFRCPQPLPVDRPGAVKVYAFSDPAAPVQLPRRQPQP